MNLLLLPLLLLPLGAGATTAVDSLTNALEALNMISFDGWSMSPDLRSYSPKGDPTAPSFSDEGWERLVIEQNVRGVDSCWLRREIVIPDYVLGSRVSGTVRLQVTVDDLGDLWVNGEYRGRFLWSGEFVLTTDARPGERFLIAVKAINTGGPLRLLKASIVTDGSVSLRSTIEDFVLSLRVGQKLLSFETYQTNATTKADPKIDRGRMDADEKRRLDAVLQGAAREVKPELLARGDVEGFRASLASARSRLGPVRDFARRFTLFFDANAHIDAAWLWRKRETIEVCRATFSSVLTMMNQRPDFTYTQSSAVYYEWMERLYPDLFSGIRERVAQGRWEIVGGMWVEPDCNLPSGESWARHLLYAHRYFASAFAAKPRIGWNPDSFGYNGNMPMLYRNAGIDAFITQKIGWNETNVFPHRLFWWESADGSRILSYFPFDYVSTVDNPLRLADWMRQYEANTGFTKLMVLFGVGDHGGGPSLEMLRRIDRLDSLQIFPRIEHGTAAAYLDWLRAQDLSSLPVWTDELYLEYHQGTFTTQAQLKEFNRRGEALLTDAEKLSSLAALHGRPYNARALEDAWRILLFNQFHDILPGSCIREVAMDAAEEHREAQAIASTERSAALRHLAGRINTAPLARGRPLIVFNTLAWTRTDLATVRLPEGDETTYAVFDASGAEVPSQTVRRSRYERDLLFVARGIPSMGYAVYELRSQPPSAATSLHGSASTIENSLFRVELDPATGWVRSVLDRRTGKELLAGPGNELQMLEDRPKAWDAWNIGWTGTRFPLRFRGIALHEIGPVRVVLRVEHDYLKPGTRKEYPTEDFGTSFFTQDIILYDGLDRIDFETSVEWWEDHTMLKVAFPLATVDTVATYEIPFGAVTRSTQSRTSLEQAQVEVPAARWADVSSAAGGVSLLNTAKYGYDIKGNVMRLSLLRSPRWPDPTADRGRHRISYSLYPHPGPWRAGSTMARGYEVNVPLLTMITDRHRGPLPAAMSMVTLSPSSLVLTAIKKAEDADAWIVQWYNTSPETVEATLVLPGSITSASLTDFLEAGGQALSPRGSSLVVPTKGSGVVTVRLTLSAGK